MNQETEILEWLVDGNTLTPLEALEMFGCLRPASRVHSLRKQGYDIVTDKFETKSGKKVASYRLRLPGKGSHEAALGDAPVSADRYLKQGELVA